MSLEKMPKIEQEFAKGVLAKKGDLVTIEELDENRERTGKIFSGKLKNHIRDNEPVILDNGFKTEPLENNVTKSAREVGKEITFWTKKDSEGKRYYYRILSKFSGEKE